MRAWLHATTGTARSPSEGSPPGICLAARKSPTSASAAAAGRNCAGRIASTTWMPRATWMRQYRRQLQRGRLTGATANSCTATAGDAAATRRRSPLETGAEMTSASSRREHRTRPSAVAAPVVALLCTGRINALSRPLRFARRARRRCVVATLPCASSRRADHLQFDYQASASLSSRIAPLRTRNAAQAGGLAVGVAYDRGANAVPACSRSPAPKPRMLVNSLAALAG